MWFLTTWISFSLLFLGTHCTQLHLTDYNETEAKILVKLAAAAYSNMPETCVNNTLPSSEHWNIVSAANTICDAHESSCSGYTIRSDVKRQFIVVFRGTKTKKQLLLEGWKSLKSGLDFYGFGMVNRYFTRALDAIWPNFEPLLKDPFFKNYTITFTGHSLGGALAALAAMRTVIEKLRSPNQIKAITFGEPRVGDKYFANKFDELVPHSYRIVHRADVVPHLPGCQKGEDETPDDDDESRPCLADLNAKVYHHGTEIWYPNGMKEGAEYVECLGKPKDEDFNCSDSLTFQIADYKDYVWDHRNYFSHWVPRYGKLGCVDVENKGSGESEEDDDLATVAKADSLGEAPTQRKKSGLLHKIVTGLSRITRFLG